MRSDDNEGIVRTVQQLCLPPTSAETVVQDFLSMFGLNISNWLFRRTHNCPSGQGSLP